MLHSQRFSVFRLTYPEQLARNQSSIEATENSNQRSIEFRLGLERPKTPGNACNKSIKPSADESLKKDPFILVFELAENSLRV